MIYTKLVGNLDDGNLIVEILETEKDKNEVEKERHILEFMKQAVAGNPDSAIAAIQNFYVNREQTKVTVNATTRRSQQSMGRFKGFRSILSRGDAA